MSRLLPALLPALTLVLAAGCATGPDATSAPTGRAPTTPAPTATGTTGTPTPHSGTPEVTHQRITVERPGVSVDLVYPQLRGGAPPGAVARINDTLRSWAEQRRDEFLAEIEDLEAPGGVSPPPGLGTATDVRGRWIGSEVASFVLEEQIYLGGASTTGDAHGFTFDLSTGERLELRDLFRPDALDELASRVVEELAARDDTASREVLEEAVTPESLDAFLVSSSGLTVLFDQYEVAAGALGIVSVDLPPERLKDLIRPNGPLATLVG